MKNEVNIKEFWNVCWKRKYDFFFFVYITTVIPGFSFLDNVIDSELYIKFVVYSLGLAIQLFVISLIFRKKTRIFFLSFCLLFTFIPNLIVLSYLTMSNVFMIRNTFFIIYESNFSESKEFIQSFVTWKVILVDILYFSLPVIYIIFSKKHNLKVSCIRFFKKIRVNYALLLTLMVLFGSIPLFKNNLFMLDCVPFTSLYKNFYRYKDFISLLNEYNEYKKEQNYPVTCHLPDSINKTFVIIIGESLSKNHMSIYGYARKTTPLLDSKANELLIYRNVISPNASTIECIKIALTFATNANGHLLFTMPSLIDLFNSTGFQTYWISNQGLVGEYDSSIGILAKHATYSIDLSNNKFSHDEIVLPHIVDILNDESAKNKVIFIHLMGNHFTYQRRYPKSFEKFNNSYSFGFRKRELKDEKEREIINEYDNSVLYNDFVISSIIDIVKEQTKFSYILYFSDHAQELFEYHDFYGHSADRPSKKMCEIPFILWRSEDYKKNVALVEDTSRLYTTEDLIYSISQLSGLEYDDYDDTKSIFSESFKEKKRFVGDKLYDNLK